MRSHLTRATQGGGNLILQGSWGDLEFDVARVRIKPDCVIQADIVASNPMALRICLMSVNPAAEVDYWLSLSNGANQVRFRVDNMTHRSGAPVSQARFEHLLFGGSGVGSASVRLAIFNDQELILST